MSLRKQNPEVSIGKCEVGAFFTELTKTDSYRSGEDSSVQRGTGLYTSYTHQCTQYTTSRSDEWRPYSGVAWLIGFIWLFTQLYLEQINTQTCEKGNCAVYQTDRINLG